MRRRWVELFILICCLERDGHQRHDTYSLSVTQSAMPAVYHACFCLRVRTVVGLFVNSNATPCRWISTRFSGLTDRLWVWKDMTLGSPVYGSPCFGQLLGGAGFINVGPLVQYRCRRPAFHRHFLLFGDALRRVSLQNNSLQISSVHSAASDGQRCRTNVRKQKRNYFSGCAGL